MALVRIGFEWKTHDATTGAKQLMKRVWPLLEHHYKVAVVCMGGCWQETRTHLSAYLVTQGWSSDGLVSPEHGFHLREFTIVFVGMATAPRSDTVTLSIGWDWVHGDEIILAHPDRWYWARRLKDDGTWELSQISRLVRADVAAAMDGLMDAIYPLYAANSCVYVIDMHDPSKALQLIAHAQARRAWQMVHDHGLSLTVLCLSQKTLRIVATTTDELSFPNHESTAPDVQYVLWGKTWDELEHVATIQALAQHPAFGPRTHVACREGRGTWRLKPLIIMALPIHPTFGRRAGRTMFEDIHIGSGSGVSGHHTARTLCQELALPTVQGIDLLPLGSRERRPMAPPDSMALVTAALSDDDVSPPGDKCVVCMEAPLAAVFLECGHVCCCLACATPAKTCFMCRAPVARVVKVFVRGTQ